MVFLFYISLTSVNYIRANYFYVGKSVEFTIEKYAKKDEKVTPKRRIRGNVNTRRNKNRNQVIIVEKEVGTPTSGSSPSSVGSSKPGLNSLDGFAVDGAKAAMRKIQTIILG